MPSTTEADEGSRAETLHRYDDGVSNRQLRKTAASGARWVGIAQVLAQVVNVGSTLVLARLLTPADFGTIAVVSVVIQFVSRTFGDTGTGAALVQRTEVSRSLADTTFAVNVAVGVVTSAALFASAGPLADLLVGGDGARSANALRILAFAPLFAGLAIVPQALLRRQSRFRLLAVANVTQAALTAVGSVILALAWDDYRALVVASLAGTALYSLMLLFGVHWRPSVDWSWREFRTISRTSRHITIFNFFGFFTAYGDRLVVARIGLTDLGHYGMGNRLMRYPLRTLVSVHREVGMPSFAKLKDDDERLSAAFIHSSVSIATLLFPVVAVGAVMSEPLVAVGLGETWRPAWPVVSLMAIIGGIQSVTGPTGGIYVTKGRTDLYLWWAVVAAVVTMFAYWAGSFWGAEGVAWGFLLSILALAPIAHYLAFRLMRQPSLRLYRALAKPLVMTLIAAGAAGAVRALLSAAAAPEAITAVVGTAAGLAVYLLATMRWNRKGYDEIVGLLRPQRRRPRVSEA